MVVMGCDNGGVKEGGGASGGEGSRGGSLSSVLMEVGRSAENAFYSFIELVSGSLGLCVTTDMTRESSRRIFYSISKHIEGYARISKNWEQ
ncbi:Variable major outer membrane lipoprotein [Borrelia duttonii CR2A]|uniref:Variable major outer membrane lipoprotein n=1 Tax=Borrelia duttonii CR2A TaxID=1432657 RepID=W6TGQ4_9SPIR|nr:Variable major outer membrane lipoprotein [Borrelia duttonii CR2A]